MKIEKESDLFEPVKKYFKDINFEVYAEIENCDVVAIKDDMLIVVELKKNFSLKLLYQAMERKIITENVYVAIPRPKNFKSSDTKSMLRLLKELNIGLLTISEMGEGFVTQVVAMPEPLGVNKKNTKRNKVLKEIQGRKININKGGINKTKILTAYKEKCIFVACLAEKYGEITVAKLKSIPEVSQCYSVLTLDYNNWFKRLRRGVYALSEEGISALKNDEYAEALKFYKEKANEIYAREENKNV